jgi:hypothetical protein
MFDNAWFVASLERPPHAQLEAELETALQAQRDAARDVERARSVSPAALAVALSSLNSTKAALGRAEARVQAATRCTHVVDGHAFAVSEVVNPHGVTEKVVASCTLPRSAVLVPPDGYDRGWSARLDEGIRRGPAPTTVQLSADPETAFTQACRWVVTGDLQQARRSMPVRHYGT